MTTTTPTRRVPAGTYSATELRHWLTTERNDGHTPADITEALVDAGWSADAAATTALESLRRSDRQTLLYAALTIAAGLAALSVGTAAHLLLSGNPDPYGAAGALTIAALTAPAAAWCARIARRTEASSPYTIWSPSRRGWFAALAACTGVIGAARLIIWLFSMFAAITGATDPLTGDDIAHVVVSAGLSIPLFAWSIIEWRRSNVALNALRD